MVRYCDFFQNYSLDFYIYIYICAADVGRWTELSEVI